MNDSSTGTLLFIAAIASKRYTRGDDMDGRFGLDSRLANLNREQKQHVPQLLHEEEETWAQREEEWLRAREQMGRESQAAPSDRAL
jgi:hypothetical protein